MTRPLGSCPFTSKHAADSADGEARKLPLEGCSYARSHGQGRRNGDDQPTGVAVKQGKFGRMFPGLPPLRSTDEAMTALATTMIAAEPRDNEHIPAGFTYLGQFVDHDITLDTTGLGEQIVDPTAVLNFRTPKLDLDCLYGRGPVADPQLYQRLDPALFELGTTNQQTPRGDPKVKPGLPFDLPRGPQGLAIIGDPRNDENLIVAQTHLAMLRFHNAVVRRVRADGNIVRSDFEDARQLVQWHYQWMVLHDLVARLVGERVLGDVLRNGRKHYRFEEQSEYGEPYMPLEFSVAAYRLGHSMVREVYDYNRVFRPGGVTPATLDLLFRFSGLSNPEKDPQRFANAIPIPSDWIIDWNRFYEIGGNKPANASLRLDPFLTPRLHDLNNSDPPSLAVRNLRRGLKMGLPSAQDVAAAMGEPFLSERDLTDGDDGKKLKELGLHLKTPLWYYILKEADKTQDGQRLGPVGARIVAEVFVGMLEGDCNSFLARNRHWKPTFGRDDDFRMADLLTFAGDLSPVDDPSNVQT
jgi:hypothetical protein